MIEEEGIWMAHGHCASESQAACMKKSIVISTMRVLSMYMSAVFCVPNRWVHKTAQLLDYCWHYMNEKVAA